MVFSGGVGSDVLIVMLGHDPGSVWSFSGTALCGYHPPLVAQVDSLRVQLSGVPLGHRFGTPHPRIQASSVDHPFIGVSVSLAYTFPSTRQYGKNRASIWRTTEPARLVRVPPEPSARERLREFAGKNCVNRPVNGSHRMCGADCFPSGFTPNQV